MSDKNILIQLNNVYFNYPAEEPIFEGIKLTIMQNEVTALVGINGSGKSTLLKLLAGELEPTSGQRITNCKPYYVPQIDLTIQQKDLPIYEYIMQYYDEWWEIPNETEKLFNLTIDTDALTKTLSGGELMKLNLTIALQHNPDLLILDEPTNHLDVQSINNLINFINETSKNKYAYLIVSHDTFFLDKVVNKVLELDNKKITTYGGNYSFYKEQKELHMRGLKKQFDIAKHKLRKAEAQEQIEYEKQQQRAAKTKKEIVEGTERDKYIRGMKKDSGAATAKAKKTAFERAQAQAAEALDYFAPDDERHLAFMNLKNTKDNRGKNIFDLKDTKLTIEDKTLIKELSLTVSYGDRLVIAGKNGSGKTSLIKALIKLNDPETKDTNLGAAKISGEMTLNENMKWVYIDQNYSLIKPELSLIENLMQYRPQYTESKAKEQLGKFKFRSVNEMNKKGKNLSGGEMVRLIMAMITAFEIDMIILDEPTNNLDVDTVAVLVKALNNFQGAIIVISHNIDFLNEIKIKKSYMIEKQKLYLMKVDPSNKEGYYKALVG